MARLEPAVMNEVLHSVAVRPKAHDAVIESLAQTPANLLETDPKPVVKATFDIDLEDLGRRLVPMFQTGDAMRAPAALPKNGGPEHERKEGYER